MQKVAENVSPQSRYRRRLIAGIVASVGLLLIIFHQQLPQGLKVKITDLWWSLN